METRVAVQADRDVIKELWNNTFGYSKKFTDWYFEKIFNPSDTLISADENGVFGSISIIPQKIKLSGYTADVSYLSGIATLPEARSDDNMKSQLTAAIAAVAQRNSLISLVIPSNYRFFERYGWRTAYCYKQYDIKPEDLPAYQIKCSITRASLSGDTVMQLNDVYNAFMADKNACTLRDNHNWMLILDDLFSNFGGKCLIFKNSEGMPVGYILSIIRERKMWVYEFAYKDRNSYESIMGYIHANAMNVDNVAIKAPVNDISYLDFCDNREAVKLCPFAMARITDAKKALYIASSNVDISFKIQIVDRLVEGNNKTFLISGGNIEETTDAPDVVTDIGTLTQLFMGYLSVDDIIRMNLIGGNGEILKYLFDKKNNYINMLLA